VPVRNAAMLPPGSFVFFYPVIAHQKKIGGKYRLIRTKYGVSSIEDFEGKYKSGEIEEKDSWQEFQKLDHLEFKKEELEKALMKIK
jgi:hypothetical protein